MHAASMRNDISELKTHPGADYGADLGDPVESPSDWQNITAVSGIQDRVDIIENASSKSPI
jgi:hypothetical protein